MDPNAYPPPGDFSWSAEKEMLADAYQAITITGSWDFFRNLSPPEGKGYMFWDNPELQKVQAAMKLLNMHSGASYGYIMRCMESIAQKVNILRMYNSKDLPFHIPEFGLPFVVKKAHADLFLKKKSSGADKLPEGMYT